VVMFTSMNFRPGHGTRGEQWMIEATSKCDVPVILSHVTLEICSCGESVSAKSRGGESLLRKQRAMAYPACVTDARIMPIHTLRNTDRLPNILNPEIAVGHVVNKAASPTARIAVIRNVGGLALPGLDPRAVGRVDQVYVFVDNVLDKVWMGRILSNGADGHAVGVVTSYVAGNDVGAVAFDGNAVITASFAISARDRVCSD
jgi:hypothetical protein